MRAVVVGAGIGGLLAARVLAEHGALVTILERDNGPAGDGHRSGVPQARHSHALLAAGANVVEDLFPGLREELIELGAPLFDLGESGRVLFPTGWAPLTDIGVPVQTFTRAALENLLRARVLALPEVTLRQDFSVEGLHLIGGEVRGVHGPSETVHADLVVVASGRTARLSKWLTEAGYDVPADIVVDSNMSYASRVASIPTDADQGWSTNNELTYAPDVRRGGVVNRVEANKWQITLIGASGERPPVDDEGFLAYARSLRNSAIAECVATAPSEEATYRFVGLNNRWTPYHRMNRWPDRLLCLGDAVCVLNPVYGQGMTVVALQAKVLHQVLSRNRDLSAVVAKFRRRSANVLRMPWIVATSADAAWTADEQPWTARVSQWYFDQIVRLIPTHPAVYRRFGMVAQMLSGPGSLLHPSVVWPVIRSAVARRSEPRRSAAFP
ncbi:FAD-dependent monooxygenase [Lentzea alba]|uniref:FAD-dependent oxidoreductase n=1 Tax=Lentzea alba TaxID=2714351 RepID=UPI0039BEF09A